MFAQRGSLCSEESFTPMILLGRREKKRMRRKDAEECGERGGEDVQHRLTLEVAFPFKSPIPLRYAELMQDLLRQWGNTAELCSLCCQ